MRIAPGNGLVGLSIAQIEVHSPDQVSVKKLLDLRSFPVGDGLNEGLARNPPHHGDRHYRWDGLIQSIPLVFVPEPGDTAQFERMHFSRFLEHWKFLLRRFQDSQDDVVRRTFVDTGPAHQIHGGAWHDPAGPDVQELHPLPW